MMAGNALTEVKPMTPNKPNMRQFGRGRPARSASSRRPVRLTYQLLDADSLSTEGRPIYPGLAEALGKVMFGEIEPEMRRVPVRELVASDEGVDPELLEDLKSVDKPPRTIPVVVLANGQLWAFDDAYSVLAWQSTSPELVIDVAIIPVESQA
jgi:hypothetical protein